MAKPDEAFLKDVCRLLEARIKELKDRVAVLEAALATCDEARALLKDPDQ